MVHIPPGHYCFVENPVIKVQKQTDDGIIEVPVCSAHSLCSCLTAKQEDDLGQVQLKYGCKEVRHAQPPFPLYDGEIAHPVHAFPVLAEGQALVCMANVTFYDKTDKVRPSWRALILISQVQRKTGERWHFVGPATYYPQPEV